MGVALLETRDLGRHLGFYQEKDITLIQRL